MGGFKQFAGPGPLGRPRPGLVGRRQSTFLLLLFLFVTVPMLGADLVINKIEVKGNTLINTQKIIDALPIRVGATLGPSALANAGQKVSDLYASQGFYQVRVFMPQLQVGQSGQATVEIEVKEDQTAWVDSLIFSGNRYFSGQKLQALLGSRYSLANLGTLCQDIADIYAKRGFLFVQVKADSLAKTPTGYLARVNVYEGKPFSLKKFRFNGNKVTTPQTLIRISGLQQGMNLTPTDLTRVEARIVKKPYLSTCRVYPLDDSTLMLQVEEGRMTLINGVLGYNNGTNVSAADRITGQAELKFLNLWGSDRSLQVFWQKLSGSSTELELSYHEPAPWIPLEADFSLYRLQRDSTYVKTTLSSEIYHSILATRYGVNLALDSYYPGSRRPRIIEQADVRQIGVFGEWDERDYYINPSTGWFARADYYWQRKNGFWRQGSGVKAEFYQSMAPGWVLAQLASLDIMQLKQIENYEYFNLGGAGSLRGFAQDAFSGYRTGVASLELRRLLALNTRLFVFGDWGFAQWQESDQIKRLTDLFSVGFGIRVDTRLGLLGLDYGVGHADGHWGDPMDGIVHFKLETAF